MDEIFRDIPRIYTALAEWAGCVVYLILTEKKRFSTVQTAAVSAGMLIVQSVFLVVTDDLPIFLWIPCMMAAIGLMYLYLRTASRMTALESGYCCAKAFLLAEFAASLEWQIHTYFLYIGVDRLWLQLLLLGGIYAAVFAAAYYLERPVFTKEYMSQLTGREFVSAAGIVAVVFAFSNLSFVVGSTPFTSSLMPDIFIIRTLVDLGGIAVLYAFQSRIAEYIAEKEMAAIHAMLKSQYEQYRNYQDSMELVHIKYHDLKHQIAGLRAETDVEKRNFVFIQVSNYCEKELKREKDRCPQPPSRIKRTTALG